MGSKFKHKVHRHCVEILEERIKHAKKARQAAQDAANSEDKSSAGDKYETSRAMGQLDRDMNARQLEEAAKELKLFMKLEVDGVNQQIIPGSLVETDSGFYFIGSGVGLFEEEGKKVIGLSVNAPLAKLMIGRKTKDSFHFNGKNYLILAIE